jgi:nucleotide-binding universal stress UspA family protein
MDTQPIIGAVDIAALSRSAGDCARWLAVESGAPLELVYVFDRGGLPALPRMDPGVRKELYDRQEERVLAGAIEQLAAIACASPGIRTSATVVEGLPVPTLRELAAERRAGLLVTGTAAREGLEHVLQGSVAGELAAAAPCPVTVIPPDAAVGETGPVIVGDDGSDHGRRAVGHAAAIAARLGREVVRMQVDEGDPVTVIGEAARDQRACLIVTGNRGRGPFRAELFGSVSTGLVQRAGRPVVLVSPQAGAAVQPGSAP